MTRATSLSLGVAMIALLVPPDAPAQNANIRPANINRSANLKSGIFRGSGNFIQRNSRASFIGGGQNNRIIFGVTNASIGGGFGNRVANHFGAVAGGLSNAATGEFAAVLGGQANTASGLFSGIGAGLGNTANSRSATVSGGERNTAGSAATTVGGGEQNNASGEGSTVGGGFLNTASGAWSTVAGGQTNMASGLFSTVAGGATNEALGTNSVVGGGLLNFASGNYSTVGGGQGNVAPGDFATVPGGYLAFATNRGAFVWSGGPISGFGTFSTNDFSFTVRAVGGVRFITSDIDSREVSPLSPGLPHGVFLARNSGSWASLSDSNAKTKITPIKPREILSKVAAMPVTQWEYKADPERRRYIGPMSQDFHAAFGLGYDDKSISTLDSDGVMYAAIQGLVEELKDRDKEIEQLKASSEKVDRLESELRALREKLEAGLPPSP